LTVRKKKQTKARKRPGRINKAKIIIKFKKKRYGGLVLYLLPLY
jgi:hypothetical protein